VVDKKKATSIMGLFSEVGLFNFLRIEFFFKGGLCLLC